MAQFFKATRTNKQNNNVIKNCLIEKLDHQGRGMLFHQNKPLFVEGGLVDEVVDITIVEDKKRYKKGRILKTHKQSELRIEPDCPHYHECGGCHLQHVEQTTQVSIKQEGLVTLFERFAKYKPEELQPALVADAWHYRRCARLGVMFNKKTKKVDMGFRRAASKELINQQVCPVLVPALEKLIVPLKALLNELQGKTSLGHIELVEAQDSVAVLLRHLKPLSEQDIQLIFEFSNKHQLYFYAQSSPTDIQCLTAEHKLTYSLPEQDCEFEFHIDDFLQVNAKVNQQMVAQAINWLELETTDQVLDLFCGLGNFTLPIAKRVKQVVGVEGIQKMVDRGTENALLSGLTNTQFFQADLSDLNELKADWAKLDYNKVLLDPARAGAAECMSFLASKKPTHIVYVSCDPVTLARDSELLLAQGYLLDKVGLIDMFPQTAHMESMALFIKK
ncbi:23S rRNA (uracil(1939)-C(5))-methyltransferase RlmD [Psychromonas algicola]|uniref:23S rRNA (uracil(1939)-C(5))-methyltransferase RlmD n=1 Tax=Psychromonas algicola TaxID=2555642 RepID=UPI0010681B3B|nr:23S rRNA (uracil(1939)-C(5))-methyltransferase RlmD [Psychromonas sp. RZ5]TEW52278.1 23S rRNA (uracil(1939)-C(5))-methyltransferase RlmD [Psychromonas sp. RZ5]